MQRYGIVLVPDDGKYMVLVPALPGCVTFGTSQAEAIEMARDAITLYVEGLAAEGEEIPEDEGALILASVDVNPSIPAGARHSL